MANDTDYRSQSGLCLEGWVAIVKNERQVQVRIYTWKTMRVNDSGYSS